MKTIAFWCATLVVFGVTNAMIASKEAAIRTGETMFLELAPRDPRSLMQGDYMALNYEIERSVPHHNRRQRGVMVVRLNDQRVAQFVRFHEGEPLAAGEHLLRYRLKRNGLQVGANAYFFQEGHASHYANARYGEYKLARTGECVLVALRNADFSKSGPTN